MGEYVPLDEQLRRIVHGELAAWDPVGHGHLLNGHHAAGSRLDPYLVDWAELFASEPVETDWLVEPLLARGRGHALYAGAKTGKSLLCLEVAAALVSGRPALARPVAERLRVLYLDYEMTPADLRERLEVFGYGPDDDLSGLFYALLPSIPPLDTEAGGEVIVEAAKRLEVDLVVIDTTARAVQGDENDADTYRALYRYTGQLLKEAGIAYVRLDHAGKDVDKGQRGSSAKNDDVDVVWQMARRDGHCFKLTATHRRMSWVPAEFELEQIEDESTGVLAHVVAVGHTIPDGVRRLADTLDRLGAPVDISKRAARELLRSVGETAKDSLLRNALKVRVPRDEAILAQILGDEKGSVAKALMGNGVPPRVPGGSRVPSTTGTPRNSPKGVAGSSARDPIENDDLDGLY